MVQRTWEERVEDQERMLLLLQRLLEGGRTGGSQDSRRSGGLRRRPEGGATRANASDMDRGVPLCHPASHPVRR